MVKTGFMDVVHLRTLRLLADLGSLRAVAAALYVSPSAVSQQLAQLTKDAGVPLTRKQGRGLALTDAGWALAEAAGDVLTSLARAEAAVAAHGEDTAAPVSVSGFHSAGAALFGQLLRVLAAQDGPPVALSDEDVAQEDFPALTATHDLVLAHRVDHAQPWPTGVRVLRLLREPFDVALPAAHPLAGAESVSAQELADETWVSSREGYSPADVVAHIAAQTHRPVRVAHRVNDYATVASLVDTGDVVAALPRFTAGATVPAGVVLRPLRGAAHHRLIEVLARPETLERRSVQRVLRALQEAASALSA